MKTIKEDSKIKSPGEESAGEQIRKPDTCFKVEMLDIKCGNTGSVRRCLDRLGVEIVTVGEGNAPSGNLPIIFPGVGSFGSVMNLLEEKVGAAKLKELILEGVPYLGICVGLQILLDGSEESPDVPGLGIYKGMVKGFTEGKIPQIGWNHVEPEKAAEKAPVEAREDAVQKTLGKPTIKNAECTGGYAYFVNSYYADPEDKSIISFTSEYFRTFCSGIKKDNVTAYQFHPERSGAYGEALIYEWLKENAGKANFNGSTIESTDKSTGNNFENSSNKYTDNKSQEGN